MHPQTLSALILLNDLRHAAMDALKQKHKLPSLLLFYSFIDICASLSEEVPAKTNRERAKKNRERFETFLRTNTSLNWKSFTPYDLWAARSSLLHSYSPLGDHTEKPAGARPIFYFAWPETREQVDELLAQRGYKNYYLMDMTTIKHVAVDGFNTMWRRVDTEPQFEEKFRENAEHVLKDMRHMLLEDELKLLTELRSLNSGDGDA
jgi:hypothetical protein